MTGFAVTGRRTPRPHVWEAIPAETLARWMGEQDNSAESGGEPSTVQAAESITENLCDHALTADEKKTAGPAVHFSLGTSSGALFGGLVEVAPFGRTGFDTAFGTVLWVTDDEVAVPAIVFSAASWTFPPSTHVYALALHLAYGATTELMRRVVRAMV